MTTTSIIAVKESSFNAQFTEKFPEEIQLIIGMIWLVWFLETSKKIVTAQAAEIRRSVVEKTWANLSAEVFGKTREKNPENKNPIRGKNTVSFKSILK